MSNIKTQKLVILVLSILSVISLTLSAVLYFAFIKEDKTVAVVDDEKALASPSVTITIAPTNTPTPAPRRLKITATGDILLGRGVGSRLSEHKFNFTYPFTDVAPLLQKGNIVFGNLEESITDSTHSLKGISEGGKYVLKNDAAAIEGIKYAGYNLVNLANNHILDYYDKGLEDTLSVLDSNGIYHSGAGKNINEARKPAIIEKQGYKIALLSYTDMAEVTYSGNPAINFLATTTKAGVAPRKKEYILEDMAKLKGKVDFILVSLHWGVEETFTITKDMTDFAHTLMDNGADIILGHHPHQFQGIELYKGKPVIYSMGNFLFDQNDPENQESFIINLEYEENKLKMFNAIPTRVENKIKVTLPKGTNAANILNREKELCEKLGTSPAIKGDVLEFVVD